jgi:glycosyltransferase involved in cell wall biosynthesis
MEQSVPVLFVSSHGGLGGSERYLRLLLGSLEPEWVGAVVSLEDGPLVEALRADGVRVEVVPAGRRAFSLLRGSRRLRSVVRRERPAVVHANGVKAALVAALALPGSGVPLVWVKHDFARDGLLARLVGRRSAQIVGVCRAVTEVFRGRTRERVHVVHNGLGAVEFSRERGRRELATALECPLETPVVGLVGRLDPGKGQEELLATLPRLRERVPDLRLAFVGGDDPVHPGFAGRLRDHARELGVEDAIGFLGHRTDALDLMAGCRALAIPSIEVGGFGREAFPYVALEAMAVGTPVACYEEGGLPEALGDCALYAPYRDREALAAALLELLVDDDRHDRLARCGRERVQTFTLERLASAMKERYLSAAGA